MLRQLMGHSTVFISTKAVHPVCDEVELIIYVLISSSVYLIEKQADDAVNEWASGSAL